MFDIQSKYKKLILTAISMKLALYFPILCWQSFITEPMQMLYGVSMILNKNIKWIFTFKFVQNQQLVMTFNFVNLTLRISSIWYSILVKIITSA